MLKKNICLKSLFGCLFLGNDGRGGGLIALKSLLTFKKCTITSNFKSNEPHLNNYTTTHSVKFLNAPGHNLQSLP